MDLGAAPGGWTVVAVELLKGKGQIIALDCLPMTPPTGVHFIQGDFTEESVLSELMNYINDTLSIWCFPIWLQISPAKKVLISQKVCI